VEFTAGQAQGVWLAAGASVSWSVAFLLVGQLFERRDTRPATFYATVAALGVFLLALALTGELRFPQTSGFSTASR
jgi:drug/metabolite transporter (DMT)-like permease